LTVLKVASPKDWVSEKEREYIEREKENGECCTGK
jgi:hypothetical protein